MSRFVQFLLKKTPIHEPPFVLRTGLIETIYVFVRVVPVVVLSVLLFQLFLSDSLMKLPEEWKVISILKIVMIIPTGLIGMGFSLAIDFFLFLIKRTLRLTFVDAFILFSPLRDATKDQIEKWKWPKSYF